MAIEIVSLNLAILATGYSKLNLSILAPGYSKLNISILAPGYSKPDEDIVKLCIIQGSSSTKSLIKHLALEYENTLEPLIVKYNYKVRSNYTANMVECDEVRYVQVNPLYTNEFFLLA